MQKAILSLFLFFSGIPFTFSQDITGTWNGVLNTPVGKLRIVFHVKDSAGGFFSTMDSPDQFVKNIPASKTTYVIPNLHLEFGNGMIVYDGTIEQDSIKGTFKQSGMELSLVLHRGEGVQKVLNRPQEPKPPFPYKSEDVTFLNKQQGDFNLAGTLTLPEKGNNFPAVVLITGSGPQDRDESIMGHKPFLVIADYLTRRGIAVLRFDDRGTAKSGGNFGTATTADFATDAEAAVQYLRSRKEINHKKIGLMGHSEGGIIAPMVAAKDKNVDFIVLLAGPGYDGKDILLQQTEAMAKAGGASPDKLKEMNEANEAVYDAILKDGNDSLLRKKIIGLMKKQIPGNLSEGEKEKIVISQADLMMSPWMRYFLKNDPKDYLRKVKCPVLAVNGSKDLQVLPEINIDAIKKALAEGGNKRVTTKIFPGLNHLFQHAQTGLPSEYSQIDETFAPEVLDYVGNWIEKIVK